jgi:presenilin-like A22 family membrane protease
MKHNIKITILILAMFVATQFIGLYVVNHFSPIHVSSGGEIQNVTAPELPYGLKTPEITKPSDYSVLFYSVLISLIIAIGLLFVFTKFKLKFILKAWFFLVIVIALGIFFYSIIPDFPYNSFVAVAIAIPLAIIKVFKRNFLIHNLTELMVYPGIAAVFVPILNIWTIFILLAVISIYDIWAVWHSGIMQKMAKFQINTLNIFSGFFIPYFSKKVRMQIEKFKLKKSKKKQKVKLNVAILGGGDIVFPIITAGVILRTGAVNLPLGLAPFIGGFVSSIFVILGATLGLGILFFFSEKKKFYPAMPFITAGIIFGVILSYLIL